MPASPATATIQDIDAELRRVVLVEDDEYVRRSLTMLLRARGLAIDVYRGGVEFLSNRGPHGAHCLLIDFKMPGIDGLTLLERLRYQGDVTPALLLTGFYSNTLKARALEIGFANVLEKPTPPGLLLNQIEHAVGKTT